MKTRGLAFVLILPAGGEGRAVTALDRKTGAVAWRAGSDDASYQSPMIADGRVVVGGDKRLVALDPADGREIWSHEHGGNGFYARIINPVATGPGELFLTYRNDESVLLRTAAKPEVAWTTKEMKLNYSTPIAWRGFLFGYSGRFLSCVDARTGALRWHSRAPGDGFPIVVDDHLVVLTKEGPLAVAPVSADGYAEKAALPLFTSLAWTPPSFAEGRIFARDSYGEIAAVDVVPARSLSVAAGDATSSLAKPVPGAEASPEAAARLRRLLDERARSPIVEDERYATFVYKGPEKDVVIRGDWLEINKDEPLRRLAGTDAQYATVELPPDARVVYQLAKADGTAFTDPANPDTGESLNYVGPVSFLYMPRSQRPPAIDAQAPLRGTITEVELEAEAAASAHLKWGGPRKLHVYLPPGYESAPERRYPTLYVLYGDEMRNGLHLPARLDREIGKTLRPLVAVFIPSTSPYEYARTFQDAHRKWLGERVVPLVDSRFRTLADPKERALFGVDEGGFAVVSSALRAPELFGSVVGQSVFPVGQGSDELLALARAPSPVRFYLDWGRYDPRRASDRTDVAGFTRLLAERLRASGHPVESRESPDGSALAFWGERLMPGLRLFFPAEAARR
jgi:enterochelin esterase family protein